MYAIALKQLSLGANLADIQVTNQQLFQAYAYSDQPMDVNNLHHQWLLQKSDTLSVLPV